LKTAPQPSSKPASRNRPKPAHPFVTFLSDKKWSLLLVVGLAVFAQWLEYRGAFSWMQGKLLNLYVLKLATVPNGHQITTIAIDRLDRSAFFCDRPGDLDPEAVVALTQSVAGMNREGTAGAVRFPKVVGVDILTESADYRTVLPRDEPRGAAGPKVVWVAEVQPVTVNGSVQPLTTGPPDFFAWLWSGSHERFLAAPRNVLGYPAEEMKNVSWGIPVFPRDDDSGVRRVVREWVSFPGDLPRPTTFARVVADEANRVDCEGGPCQRDVGGGEIFMPYGVGDRNIEETTVGALFECRPPHLAGSACEPCRHWRVKPGTAEKLADQIVLLGGTYDESAFVPETPERRSARTQKTRVTPGTSGLRLNALAVDAELQGDVLVESLRPLAFASDILLGWLVVAGFHLYSWWMTDAGARPFLGRLCLLAFTLIVLGGALALFREAGIVWLEWMVVVAGIALFHWQLERQTGRAKTRPLSDGPAI
jgi:hypothetical protein